MGCGISKRKPTIKTQCSYYYSDMTKMNFEQKIRVPKYKKTFSVKNKLTTILEVRSCQEVSNNLD